MNKLKEVKISMVKKSNDAKKELLLLLLLLMYFINICLKLSILIKEELSPLVLQKASFCELHRRGFKTW